ncbi:MAG: right-handed parallel beta-helix repeat-containing protein [Methanomicrobia archaeon]|nr:right-handed parallel beta-helix repeat-containing protein [Methanomicrobia archaeon]
MNTKEGVNCGFGRGKAIIGIVLTAVLFASVLGALVPISARDGAGAIERGDIVFCGEEGLDVSAIVVSGSYFYGMTGTTTEGATIFVADNTDFDVSASAVEGPYNATSAAGTVADIVIDEPKITGDVFIEGTTYSVVGKAIPRGTKLTVHIEPNFGGLMKNAADGSWSKVKLKLLDPDGILLTPEKIDADTPENNVTSSDWSQLDTSEWRIGQWRMWITTDRDTCNDVDVSSPYYEFTVRKEELTIDAEEDAVDQGEDINVTITGNPFAFYYLTVTNVDTDNPPMILYTSDVVVLDEWGDAYPATGTPYLAAWVRTGGGCTANVSIDTTCAAERLYEITVYDAIYPVYPDFAPDDDVEEDDDDDVDVWVNPHEPRTIYVPDDYATIQEAVTAANPFDIIIVRDGTYTENVDFSVANLTIRSENGSDKTIVNALDPNDHVLEITVNYVNVSGFTIGGGWCGVYLRANYCNISNNTLSNNSIGINIEYSNHNILIKNKLSNNYYGNLLCSGHSKTDFDNVIDTTNTINDYPVYYYFDQKDRIIKNLNTSWIGFAYCSNFTIQNNSIHHGEGVSFVFCNDSRILKNKISNNSGNAFYKSKSNVISENEIHRNIDGLLLLSSDYNEIINNSLDSNEYGISLHYSKNNNLKRNNMSNQYKNLEIMGSLKIYYNNTIDDTNTIKGLPLYYYYDEYDLTIKDARTHYLGIASCDNVTIRNSDIGDLQISFNNQSTVLANNISDGMQIYVSNNTTVIQNNITGDVEISRSNNNTLKDNVMNAGRVYPFSSSVLIAKNLISGGGISFMYNSPLDLIIENNTIFDCEYGIECFRPRPVRGRGGGLFLDIGIPSQPSNPVTQKVIIKNNEILKNTYGISLRWWPHGTTITNNGILDNDWGIYLENVDSCTIANNTISNNENGVYLQGGCYDNLIYNNYFNNTKNAYDDGYNIWNITKTSEENIAGGGYLGGNYWSDYEGEDTDLLPDGLGDTLLPYNSSGNITNGGDWHPLVMAEEEPYTNIDVGVTSSITLADSSDLAAYLPPEYDGIDIGDAVVLNVNVTDNTSSTTDDAYTDITINVGDLDVATCTVFKTGTGFLQEVEDVNTLPTVDGEPSFSRDLVNKTVTARLYVGDPLLGVIPFVEAVFDTGTPDNPYPSISGIHNGTITLNQTILVSKLYTYSCSGTGGHTEYARIWNSTLNVTATWDGYNGDWHNLNFNDSFTLYENETYNYTIRTGSYPQIIHESPFNATGGTIRCTSFEDANGEIHTDWIPAIRLE